MESTTQSHPNSKPTVVVTAASQRARSVRRQGLIAAPKTIKRPRECIGV